MKSAAIIVSIVAICMGHAATAQNAVSGYTRSDGTYVAPYYRSSPNSSYNDNYGVSPNVNPYTGRQGTLPPTYNDRPPARAGELFDHF